MAALGSLPGILAFGSQLEAWVLMPRFRGCSGPSACTLYLRRLSWGSLLCEGSRSCQVPETNIRTLLNAPAIVLTFLARGLEPAASYAISLKRRQVLLSVVRFPCCRKRTSWNNTKDGSQNRKGCLLFSISSKLSYTASHLRCFELGRMEERDQEPLGSESRM